VGFKIKAWSRQAVDATKINDERNYDMQLQQPDGFDLGELKPR